MHADYRGQRCLGRKRQSTLTSRRVGLGNPDVPKFLRPSPLHPHHALIEASGLVKGTSRAATLTRVNTIPPRDPKQEVYCIRHLKLQDTK